MTLFRRDQCSLAIISVCFVLLLPSVIAAQVEKRVVFAKGKNSASYQGKLPRDYADYDAYIFRAKRGQTLSFKLTTSDPQAYIAVYETKQELGPDEDLISAGDDQYPRVWSGKLPVTSEFSLQVYGAREIGQHSNRSAYMIEITLK